MLQKFANFEKGKYVLIKLYQNVEEFVDKRKQSAEDLYSKPIEDIEKT
jgi:hypothetical protein